MAATPEERLALRLDQMGLKSRTVTLLNKLGIVFVRDLVKQIAPDLISMSRLIGQKTVVELKENLNSLGWI